MDKKLIIRNLVSKKKPWNFTGSENYCNLFSIVVGFKTMFKGYKEAFLTMESRFFLFIVFLKQPSNYRLKMGYKVLEKVYIIM